MTAFATAADPRTWTDAHLHAWDTALLAAPWLAEAPQFAGRFDLVRFMAEGGVGGGAVLVEADVASRDRLREAQLLAAWGAAGDVPFATVAGIEPGSDSFHEDLASIGGLRGIAGARRVMHGGHIPFGGARFVADLRALGVAGLSFDFCVRWSDLALVEHCARDAPETTVVLDHLGNPPLRAGWNSPERSDWQRSVARVAACGNASVKWSAMFENAGRAITADEARPWFEWCLACFGARRVLWGSNWPVCFANARLAQWIELSAALAGELAPDEQGAILGGNCARVYRVERRAHSGDSGRAGSLSNS